MLKGWELEAPHGVGTEQAGIALLAQEVNERLTVTRQSHDSGTGTAGKLNLDCSNVTRSNV